MADDARGDPPDPRRRFADRVDDYERYRPHYPPAVVAYLRDAIGLTSDRTVADVGSGTGISSRLFLDAGHRVVGVEPNAEMRAAAERALAATPKFTSVDGSAEATGLPGASVDLVVAGQAFHWFDPLRARNEFRRILRPGRFVALLWNTRKLDHTPFLSAYERLLVDHGTDYGRVRHDGAPRERIAAFFGPGGFRSAAFPNGQTLDYEGLRGRLLSSSYAPAAGQPRHEPMLAELRRIFDAHHEGGRVTIAYDTELYVGPLT